MGGILLGAAKTLRLGPAIVLNLSLSLQSAVKGKADFSLTQWKLVGF